MSRVTFRRGIPPLLILALITGCSAPEQPQVQIAAVTMAPISEIVEAPATVGARATATLTAPAPGTIAKVYVEEGDTVKKGQILVRISSPQARAQLDQARKAQKQASRRVSFGGLGGASLSLPRVRLSGSLDREVRRCLAQARKAARKVEDPTVKAQLLAAIDTAEAQQRAFGRNIAQAVDGLNQSVSRAVSQVSGQLGAGLSGMAASMSSLQAASRAQANVAVEAAESTVDGLVIKAPFGGVVALGGPSSGGGSAALSGLISQLPAGLSAQAGAAAPPSGTGRSAGVIATGVPVAAGDTIATVTDVSTLTLSADVDETDVLLVEPGTKAEVEFDAVTGATYTAEVTGVGVTPQEGTTGGVSYPVRLRLGDGVYDDQSPAPDPKPGMSAVVRLTVRETPDAIAVPASAIVSSGRESVVWLVRNGKAERRVVRLGAQGDAAVQVVSGLAVGDRVIVRGADTVRQGQTVS
jgi:multidrug efflux pump subunit AcrA (membrane-fusion protein)